MILILKYAHIKVEMDKFGFRYGAHAQRKKQAYLDYDRMKDYLHEHEIDETDALVLAHTGSCSHNSAFLQVFFAEIDRVNKSYKVSLDSILETFKTFQILASSFMKDESRDRRQKKVREATLKRNATILYRKMIKLEDFRLLNRTAAIKILKKYDKITARQKASACLNVHMDHINTYEFGHGKALTSAKNSLIQHYADLFCDGELEEAQLKLSLAKTDISLQVMQWVALKLGIIVALCGIILQSLVVAPYLSMLFLLGEDTSVYVYAAVGALITYRWFWGFSVCMWDHAGVDYVLVLNLDPNKHMPNCADIFSDAGTLTVLYLVNFWMFHMLRYYHHHRHGPLSMHPLVTISHYALVMPVLLVVGTIVRLSISYMQPTSYGVFSTKIASRVRVDDIPFLSIHLIVETKQIIFHILLYV
jgi:hypothetical protein